ncbi:MAG: hypothetical protein IIC18_09560, partial [Bacteroidetes bacterium]|nr:hypothetical protein [Bacteroidota bacterium]
MFLAPRIRPLPAFLLSLFAFALLAGPVASQEHGESIEEAVHGEELDALHHSADGFFLDFEPIGKVELPRL